MTRPMTTLPQALRIALLATAICAAGTARADDYDDVNQLMRQGKLNIRQTDTAFEHAMSQVLGRLRSSGQESPPAG